MRYLILTPFKILGPLTLRPPPERMTQAQTLPRKISIIPKPINIESTHILRISHSSQIASYYCKTLTDFFAGPFSICIPDSARPTYEIHMVHIIQGAFVFSPRSRRDRNHPIIRTYISASMHQHGPRSTLAYRQRSRGVTFTFIYHAPW